MKNKPAIWPQVSAKFPFLSLSFGYFSSSIGCHERCPVSCTSPVLASRPTALLEGQFEPFSTCFHFFSFAVFVFQIARRKDIP